jgi:hypothetical protein
MPDACHLLAAGLGLDHFAHFRPLLEGAVAAVACTGLHIRCVRSQHSELCYGFLLYRSVRSQGGAGPGGGLVPLLGWSADSGCSAELYRQLAAAPVLLLDARRQPSHEHAGFEQLAGALAQQRRQGWLAEAGAGAVSSAAEDGVAAEVGSTDEGCAAAAAGEDGRLAAAGAQAAAGPSSQLPGASEVFITGYGRQDEAPPDEWLRQQAKVTGVRFRAARPGKKIRLWPPVTAWD